ncbi:hypothetical protein G7Y89_g4554 [Cudoniella acicularis]|uniref:Ankyrin n=1 Tax=Cudoniella acicularis TaxID=354080 RepID=A0A8H4RP84_9HELO|nr:hypothetical protein G7Y89_g4554 [Cudoniella acicularis]
MSGSKQSKYDWDVHFPRLRAFYLQGLSFPEIHRAVLTPDFTPSEKTVYNKLIEGGYPADKTQRAALCKSLNIARWPSETIPSSKHHGKRLVSGTAFSSNNTAAEGIPRIFGASNPSNVDADTQVAILRRGEEHTRMTEASNYVLENLGQAPPNYLQDLNLLEEQAWLNTPDFSSALAQEDNSYCQAVEFNPSLSAGMHFSAGSFTAPLLHSQGICSITQEDFSQYGQLVESSGLQQIVDADYLSESNIFRNMPTPNDIPDLVDVPSPFSIITLPPTPNFPQAVASSSSSSRSLERGKPRIKALRLFNPDRNSSSTYDSGYVSGRSSPFSLRATERPTRRIPPTCPFDGLHRVPCNVPHEPRRYNASYSPQSTERYRNIVGTCEQCKYSAIHNLSWSAQYLKFEVFASELNLSGIYYDLTAIDAAGNSALHYAAIGGATLGCITSLLDAGINPCHINTCGELFLHCMRPQFDQVKLGFEADVFPAFKTNLVNLLNDLSQKYSGFFRWRDNAGRTALQTFISNIGDDDIKSRVTETVTSAGYNVVVSDGFENIPQRPIDPTTYTFFLDANAEGAFDFNRVRQRIAREITKHASTDPTFVHPETGDNILHALARLRFQESADLITQIRDFASQDVDLNLRNWNEDGPLSTFTQEPPAEGPTRDDTGATISKYLDALLWKDPKKRIPNKINVNMRNREGATPLYYAAIRARPDSVRSLIEAGANVNARLEIDGRRTSALLASEEERNKAFFDNNVVKIDRLNNVISYLQHAKAVSVPTLFDERCVCENTGDCRNTYEWRPPEDTDHYDIVTMYEYTTLAKPHSIRVIGRAFIPGVMDGERLRSKT